MNTDVNRELSLAAKICLGYSILMLIIGAIRAANVYFYYGSLSDINPVFCDRLILIALNIAMIFCAIFIFKKKKWALILFLVLAIVRIFAVVPAETNAMYGTFLGMNLITFLKDCAPFVVALFFPKQGGVSGWQVFFGKNED